MDISSALLFLVLSLTISQIECFSFSECLEEGGKAITNTICLPPDYSVHTLPMTPLVIKPTMTFGGVRDLDETSQTMTIKVWLNLNWIDPKLVGNQSQDLKMEHVGHEYHEHVWVPDLHIKDLIKFEEIFITSSGSEIFAQNQDGQAEITMTLQAIVTTSCTMEFGKFPFDKQICQFMIGTDSGNVQELTFDSHIISNQGHAHFQEFRLDWHLINEQVSWPKFSKKGIKDASFSGTGFNVFFKRNWIPYMWSYYLPALGLSLVGSVSFLIMPEMVPGRVALLLTLLLVLINFFGSIQEKVPISDELTAIGIYIQGIIALAISALFEYAVILYRIKMRFMAKHRKMGHHQDKIIKVMQANEQKAIAFKPPVVMPEAYVDCKIDQMAFMIYLLVLFLFHLVYFGFYFLE